MRSRRPGLAQRLRAREGVDGKTRLGDAVDGRQIADLPTVNRIAEACLAIDAFARAQPLRQPGAPASH